MKSVNMFWVLMVVIATTVNAATLYDQTPLIIAHRGVPAYRLEETLASYELAGSLQADFIETDLCVTSDEVLICRHECELGETTDIATRPEFADRKRNSTKGDSEKEGWFTEDFTIAEIRTLRVKERIPDIRTTAYDGLYQVITLNEFLQLAQSLQNPASAPPGCTKAKFGVYIETKTPSHFRELGFNMEEILLATLKEYGYEEQCKAASQHRETFVEECGVVLQSFENNLATLDCAYPKVQLLDTKDAIQVDTGVTYGSLMTEEGLKEVAKWANGIGPYKMDVIDYTVDTYPSTGLLETAHSLGLLVHPYTLRTEPIIMNGAFNNDPEAEFIAFFTLGVDGVFTDSCDVGKAALQTYSDQDDSTIFELIKYVFYVLTLLFGILLLLLLGAVGIVTFRKSQAKKKAVLPTQSELDFS